MRFVQPRVYLIAKSVPDDHEIAAWLRSIGCDDATTKKYADGKARVLGGFSDAAVKSAGERITELAGRRCYLSFQPGLNPNVQKIRTDIADYCENILKSGHGSVLEHTYFTFAIENVSRVFTGEMNRHRAGVAISEGSMRFIRYTDIPVVETPLLQLTDDDLLDSGLRELENADAHADVSHLKSIACKKARTREIFQLCVREIERCYKQLQEIWSEELKPESKFAAKKHITSMMRRIIPMGVATGGVWTANIRALRHICTMRCSEAAEEEIALVAGKILEIMMQEESTLFGDFHLSEKGYWTPKYVKV